eukprot:scaffold90154_cov56-Phaeocystis_antarctica.AAC.2
MLNPTYDNTQGVSGAAGSRDFGFSMLSVCTIALVVRCFGAHYIMRVYSSLLLRGLLVYCLSCDSASQTDSAPGAATRQGDSDTREAPR